MAVNFLTADPEKLLANFNTRIEQDEEEGKITTWERSDDLKYYTHKAKDWHSKAWFKPKTYNNKLTFNIIKPKNANVTTVVYGYYHGHLIETFLNHFDTEFTTAEATALPTSDDNCTSS